MQVKVTEEFYRKRAYTHRYDHLHNVNWEIVHSYELEGEWYHVIQYYDVVTDEEITNVY